MRDDAMAGHQRAEDTDIDGQAEAPLNWGPEGEEGPLLATGVPA